MRLMRHPRHRRRPRASTAAALVLAAALPAALVASTAPGTNAAQAAASRWTWDLPDASQFLTEKKWVAPDGATWLTVLRYGQQNNDRTVIRIDRTGQKTYEQTLPLLVYSMTFDGSGTAYFAGMSTDVSQATLIARVYAVTPAGASTVVGDFPWDTVVQQGPLSIQYGPDGKLYFQVLRTLHVIDPNTHTVLKQVTVEATSGGPDGGFIQTGTDALRWYDYVGDFAQIRSYTDLAHATTLTPPTRLAVARPSIGRDGSTLIVGNSTEASLTSCDDVHAERFSPTGALQFDVTLASLAGSGHNCKLIGLGALPNNASVVATFVDDDVNPYVLWLDNTGKESARAVPTVPSGWTAQTIADMVTDDQGNAVIAYTISGKCADDVQYNLNCGEIRLGEYSPAGSLVAEATVTGDGDPQSLRRFARLTSTTTETPSIYIADGYVVLTTNYEPGDPGACAGCATNGSTYALDAVPMPVSRPDWKDPTLPRATSVNHSPVWATGPDSGTRFDLTPGNTATFSLTATDADGQPVDITTRFTTPSGTTRRKPDYVTCTSTNTAGRATLTCTVAPKGDGLAVMYVNAVDTDGAVAGERSFLVAGSPKKYVALGDSFSAGEGVDPYFFDGYSSKGIQTGTIENRCHRSSRAYAESVQALGANRPLYVLASGTTVAGTGSVIDKYGSESNLRRNRTYAWGLLACSGAKINNVLPTALGGQKQPGKQYKDPGPQLDSPFIDFGTDLVTITISGNDAGFGKVLTDCAEGSCANAQYEASLDATIDALQPRLVALFDRIKSQTFNARIIVLGYPQLFPVSAAEQHCTKLIPWRGEQDMVRRAGIRLNNIISVAADSAKVEFIDVAEEFSGHEVCGSKGEWINGKSSGPGSFHPNIKGQRAYGEVLALAVAR